MSGQARSANYELRIDAARFEAEQIRRHLSQQSRTLGAFEDALAQRLASAVERQVGSAAAAETGRSLVCAAGLLETVMDSYAEALGHRPDAAAAARVLSWAGCDLMDGVR